MTTVKEKNCFQNLKIADGWVNCLSVHIVPFSSFSHIPTFLVEFVKKYVFVFDQTIWPRIFKEYQASIYNDLIQKFKVTKFIKITLYYCPDKNDFPSLKGIVFQIKKSLITL